MLENVLTTLSASSSGVIFQVYTGNTAEQAFASSPIFSGTWVAGRNVLTYIHRSGVALYIKVLATSAFAFERMIAWYQTLGPIRQRWYLSDTPQAEAPVTTFAGTSAMTMPAMTFAGTTPANLYWGRSAMTKAAMTMYAFKGVNGTAAINKVAMTMAGTGTVIGPVVTFNTTGTWVATSTIVSVDCYGPGGA